MVDWVWGHAPFPTINMLGNIVIEGEVIVALCFIVGLMLGWHKAHNKTFAMMEDDGTQDNRRHTYFNIPVILDKPETLKYTGHIGLLEDAIESIKGLSEFAEESDDHELVLRMMKDHYRHAEDILYDIGCGLGERSHQ